MRLIPVKTKPFSRQIWVKFVMREIGLRMREVHGNPDVWLLESKAPAANSPWEQTRAYGDGLGQAGSLDVTPVVDAEAQLRIGVLQDYFVGLRATMQTRRAYSLHVLCRSAIEACAFSAWIFDPGIDPAERALRGILLRRQSLEEHLRSLKRELKSPHPDKSEPENLLDVDRAKNVTEGHLSEMEWALQEVSADIKAKDERQVASSVEVPSATQRVRELLCDDMELPQGSDAYHRLSGVTHSNSIGILGTWNIDDGKPFIDYYTFLTYLHLALCAITFSLERRAACWGDTYKSTGLNKIIGRLERVIEGEPGVLLLG